MPKFFLLLVIALLLTSPARADDPYSECDSYRDVPVHVTPRFDEPNYDYGHSIGAITSLSSDSRHSIREALTLGLTRYEPMLEMRVPIAGVQLPDGLACAHVERVDVTVGYQYVTIYIGNEISQGTCGFNEVMAHEQKHIAANLQTLQEYTPLIETELAAYVRENGVFRETNLDYATKLLHDKLQEIIQSIMDHMEAENRQRQQAIDTPAEYARVSATCNGQLRVIAQRAFSNNRNR